MIGNSIFRTYFLPLARLAASGFLIWVIGYNFWGFSNFGGIPDPGMTDETVIRDRLFEPIRGALILNDYKIGHLDYINSRSVRGEPRTQLDDFAWGKSRFSAIPYSLVRDTSDSPYVLGDFTEDNVVPPAPQGLVLIANPGNGFVLYKRVRQ